MPTETEKEEIGKKGLDSPVSKKPGRTTNEPWQMLKAAFFKRSISKS